MAAELEKLAMEVREKGIAENQPDWLESADALSHLSRSLKLPETVGSEMSQNRSGFSIPFPESVDPVFLKIRRMRLAGVDPSEIADSLGTHKAYIQLVMSYLTRAGLLPKGRPPRRLRWTIQNQAVDNSYLEENSSPTTDISSEVWKRTGR